MSKGCVPSSKASAFLGNVGARSDNMASKSAIEVVGIGLAVSAASIGSTSAVRLLLATLSSISKVGRIILIKTYVALIVANKGVPCCEPDGGDIVFTSPRGVSIDPYMRDIHSIKDAMVSSNLSIRFSRSWILRDELLTLLGI